MNHFLFPFGPLQEWCGVENYPSGDEQQNNKKNLIDIDGETRGPQKQQQQQPSPEQQKQVRGHISKIKKGEKGK
jgi:hypothetical protein